MLKSKICFKKTKIKISKKWTKRKKYKDAKMGKKR